MKKFVYSTLAASIFASASFAGVAPSANSDGYYEISDPIDSDTVRESSAQYLLTELVYVSDAKI